MLQKGAPLNEGYDTFGEIKRNEAFIEDANVTTTI